MSAKDHDGTKEVIDLLMREAPERPWLFDREEVTDQSDLKMTEEIIREKLFLRLNQELPYETKQVRCFVSANRVLHARS